MRCTRPPASVKSNATRALPRRNQAAPGRPSTNTGSAEDAAFTPSEAGQQGLTGSGAKSVPTSGDYNTNEFSAELLIPVLGGDFTLPFVRVSRIYRSHDPYISSLGC